MSDRPRFVTFEGVDGAGKSTLIERIAHLLEAHACTVRRTREPGGTPLGEALRATVLHQPMEPLTELLLMFAARNEHVRQVIEPALAAGHWVLCDRFTDASYAYQGAGRGVGTDYIDTLARWTAGPLVPDCTVLIDIDPAEARRRRSGVREPDRFEREEDAFFRAVRSAYLDRARADPARFCVVPALAAPEALAATVWSRLQAWVAP